MKSLDVDFWVIVISGRIVHCPDEYKCDLKSDDFQTESANSLNLGRVRTTLTRGINGSCNRPIGN